jgi:hypothetical protein
MNVGQEFSTGNSTVRSLPIGAVLEVVGPGRLAIADLPVKEYAAGDRILTKYGPSTVVRMTSRLNNPVEDGANVLYIADGTNVVRIAQVENVSSL